MTRGSVTRELGGALVALGVLLVVVLAAAVFISHDLEAGARRGYAREAIPTKSAAQDLVLQMVNEAGGARAFLTTGLDADLAPYRNGRREVRRDVALLDRSTARHPELRESFERTRGELMALDRFYTGQVELGRTGTRERARALRNVLGARLMFARFRDSAAALAARADAFVADTEQAQHDRYRTLLIVLGAVGLAALAIAVTLIVVIPRRTGQQLRERSRRLAEEREARETLHRVLALTPRFLVGTSPEEVSERVCEAAVQAFGCAAASLWVIEGPELRLAARVPWSDLYEGGDRRTIAELPGLAEALAEARPLYVPSLRTDSTGRTRETAEALRSGTLLNVPVAIAGQSELMLGLLWTQQIDEPSRGLREAAQRFADQAALAIEQARRRLAQTEVESLNATLQRMVSTDPLFRADGNVHEVAEAICVAARDVFHAQAAALWAEEEDGVIELRHRTPATPALPVGTRMDPHEFPQFAAEIATGRPHFLADVQQDEPSLWHEYARHSGSASQLRLPLAGSGQAGGLIVLSWPTRVEPPSREEQAVAARFAGQAAVALAEAERREARREADRLHERLERSLLPTIEVDDPRVRLSSFYRAGDERLSLGGDFYDCIEREDGSIAMVIGDVSGHGPAAAALGASLRSAWRALALVGDGPVEQLDGLESVLVRERDTPEMFVTVLAGVIAPDRATVAFSTAGHPPALVVGRPADGIDYAGAPPLGVVSGTDRELTEVPIASPSSIILYTDGLIEGRADETSSERFGVERVEELLRDVDPGAVDETELGRLVEAATNAHGSCLPDDVALRAVNLAPTGWSRSWPAEIESVPELRAEVERFARGEGLDDAAVHAVKLAVAEVASNAVVHGYVGRPLPGKLTIQGHRAGDLLHVTVSDDGTGLRPRSDSPGLGLGLAMIAQLADGLDIDTPPAGGTVVRLRFRV